MKKLKTMIICALCAVLAGCGIFGQTPAATATPAPTQQQTPAPTAEPTPTEAPTATPTAEATPAPTPTPEPVEVSIMAVGDIMFHRKIIDSGYDKESKSYNYDYNFQYIKDVLSSADLALGNFECTLGGPDKEYSLDGGKIFSAPDEAADALKNAGFDILTCANNHITNKGADGLIRTAAVFREKGIIPIGIRVNTDEQWYIVQDVKGIKIGFTAYTYGSGNDKLFQSFASTDSQLEKMSAMVQQMRAEGAEIVVFFMHWGAEHQRMPNSSQKRMAEGMADIGVDIVFGSHPHTMQPVDVITSSVTGKKTVVVYSLGNFISNQRSEFNAAWTYAEDCMVACVKITKQPDGSAAYVSAFEYLPTWTLMYTQGGKRRYTVLPVEKALQSPEAYDLTTSSLVKQAQLSLDNTNELLADAVNEGKVTAMAYD